MVYDKYHDDGRTLKIELECYRCKQTVIENLEDVENRSVDHNNRITWLTPPKGWHSRQGWIPLLCDKCNEDLDVFLNEKVIRD